MTQTTKEEVVKAIAFEIALERDDANGKMHMNNERYEKVEMLLNQFADHLKDEARHG